MIAQVGMAVNRVAAMPIKLREIAMDDMAWVTGVAQTARGAVTPHCDVRRPTTTSTHKPHPNIEAPSQPSPREGTEKLKPTIKLKVDDGEIAVLPFVFCLFQPYLGDLQKEKLQIVSIYRFGLKIRGLFQCPPKGKECHTTTSNTTRRNSSPLGRAGDRLSISSRTLRRAGEGLSKRLGSGFQ